MVTDDVHNSWDGLVEVVVTNCNSGTSDSTAVCSLVLRVLFLYGINLYPVYGLKRNCKNGDMK